MPTLLLAEHDNSALKDATNKALTAAKQLGGEVHVLVAGQNCKAVAEAAAKLDGVGKVLVADAPGYAHMLAEPTAALIVALAPPYDTLMAPATTTGKNIMPRVAALLDVMQISDVTKVLAPDTFERPIYAGNAVQTVRSAEKKRVITVRTAAVQATGAGGASAPIEPAATVADPELSGAEPCKTAKTSPNISNRWRTSLARQSAPRAPRSMPAMRPTIGRSVRPAKLWPRTFTSRSAFQVPFSISLV